jgi:hypothetical protein
MGGHLDGNVLQKCVGIDKRSTMIRRVYGTEDWRENSHHDQESI